MAGTWQIATGFTTIFDGCTQQPETEEPGIAEYDFPVTPAGGFTLGGAPTVIADVSVANGGESQIAARLLEISGGQERIVARGVYRPGQVRPSGDPAPRQRLQVRARHPGEAAAAAPRRQPGSRGALLRASFE